MESGDAVPQSEPASAVAADATSGLSPETPDDRAARRAALRDLAAMVGVEVFY